MKALSFVGGAIAVIIILVVLFAVSFMIFRAIWSGGGSSLDCAGKEGETMNAVLLNAQHATSFNKVTFNFTTAGLECTDGFKAGVDIVEKCQAPGGSWVNCNPPKTYCFKNAGKDSYVCTDTSITGQNIEFNVPPIYSSASKEYCFYVYGEGSGGYSKPTVVHSSGQSGPC